MDLLDADFAQFLEQKTRLKNQNKLRGIMRKNMYSSARLQRSTRHNFDKQVTFVSFLNKVEKWIDARASKEVAGAEWKRR